MRAESWTSRPRYRAFAAGTSGSHGRGGEVISQKTLRDSVYLSGGCHYCNMCVFVGFEVFTAVTMKNAVFWDIKTELVPHSRHITSPLQSPAS
jgi:hypothetical protein